MPTAIVGLHVALAGLYALTGLSFLLDPCGGGGDLCLGGYIGLLGIGLALAGAIGVGMWTWRRRASALLVWDAFLVAIGGFVFVTASGTPSIVSLASVLTLLLGVPGGALAGREVARHRVERVLAGVALLASFLLGPETGTVVTVSGVLAIASGWLLNRTPKSVRT